MKNYQKIKFYSNEKERVTYAVMRFSDLEHEFGDVYDDWYFDIWEKLRGEPGPFKGVAHCAKEDTWNEEVGKSVARNKLELNIYKAKKKYLSKKLQEAIDTVEKYNNELAYAARKYEDAKKRIEENKRG